MQVTVRRHHRVIAEEAVAGFLAAVRRVALEMFHGKKALREHLKIEG
jgi:hypothetical protein